MDPKLQHFDNVYCKNLDRVNPWAILRIKSSRMRVVAMGNKVKRVLTMRSIPHVTIPHPAARGKIRLKSTYCEVVKTTLLASGIIGQLVCRNPTRQRTEPVKTLAKKIASGGPTPRNESTETMQ